MKYSQAPVGEYPGDEIAALVQNLHETQRRLMELTGGDLDAVLHPSGQSYLLREAQEQLQRSEAAQRDLATRQLAILNAVPAHIALLDPQGVIISSNESWKQFATASNLQGPGFGVGDNYLEICGRAMSEFCEEAHAIATGIRAVLQGETKTFSAEYPRRSPAEHRWFRLVATPLDENDRAGAVVMHIDITEAKKNEERLRLITDLVPHGIFAKDAAGRHIFANPALAEIAGLSIEEILGKTDFDLVADKAQAEAYREDDRAVMHSGSKMVISEEPRTDLSGRTRFLQTIKIPFTVPETGERAVMGVCMDITERKRSEEALLRQQTELNVLFDLMPAMVCFKDTKNVFLRVNPRLAEAAGMTISEIEGKSAEEVFPLDADKYYADDIEIIRTGTAKLGIIEKLRSLDGKSSWVQTDKVPVCDIHGQVTGIVVMVQDITERRRAEEALRQSEGNMAAAQRLAHFGSWELELANLEDIAANRVRWSDEIFRIAGYEPGEFEPSNALFFAHVPVEEHAAIHGAMATAIRERGQYSIVHRLIRPDGEERTIHEVAEVICDQETGRPLKIIGTTHDITERTRTEARFRLLVDSNVQGVFFWNTKGKITGANDAFLGMVGYTREDLDAGIMGWAEMTPPEYAEADRRALAEAAATGICKSYEKEYIRKDGTRVPILLGAAMFEDSPEDGICFVLDLTERKKIENQFLRAQRMESIGTLAGGIAHDLNNILAPIMMSINILQDIATDPQTAAILDTIQVSAKRGADIVRQVLSFARGIEGERVEIQPKHLLKDLESIIRDTFPKDLRLQFSVPNDTWTILGDPTQMHQILLNLCVNARDAMPDGGVLSIGVENARLDEHYAAMKFQAKPGNYVNISVTDSGTGIPPEIIEKIFEPFFTTKEVGKGTGLGLSTVIAIVKSHGGFVNVYSEPGKGTTFKVYLPAVDVPSASEAARGRQGEVSMPRGNGEMILLVDDEPSLSLIASQTLEAFGYRVLSATDGADAVAVYLAHRNDVAIVLTDMMMPVMDGPAMIHALRRVNREVKIIATSGLNANYGMAKLADLRIKHFLTKPYTAETLLKTLRTVLEEA
jgi:PAS domain S-box-containing protein